MTENPVTGPAAGNSAEGLADATKLIVAAVGKPFLYSVYVMVPVPAALPLFRNRPDVIVMGAELGTGEPTSDELTGVKL